MKQKILTMLELQDAMNRKVNDEWRAANYPWYRAIWTECAEMLDHYGWKWWKHQKPDMAQVKLEIVDIWHFALSAKLMQGLSLDETAEQVMRALDATADMDDIRQAIEVLAHNAIETRDADIGAFAALMHCAGMPFDELYKTYVGKNVLNFFRQDHGYKDGSYIKLWHGREDNEHLAEILEQLNPDDRDFSGELYRRLEAVYPA